MPIKNENIQIIFGTGDIGVQIAWSNVKKSGVVEFIEIEPRPIGKEFTTKQKTMNVGEAPVTLVFNEIESLEAVIYQLQKLKGIMSNEIPTNKK
ncbi:MULTISPECIES: hypothetical protein [Solibacillus]|uniref:hypothetical protein n=1 Tax=Solibacillus TaxID=648800 RepID=UPI0007FB3387|nr:MULTISPECIES: hypothetical protein [Solibacillus]OBW54751.1 hypothetical protein A9986_14105 [Solibacillus silvestris]